MNRFIEGLRPDDGREVVRIIAGILIAVGMVMVGLRRGTPEVFGETTSNFGLFVIFGLPAGFLYGAGILGRTLGGYDRRWQALYTVTGMILAPIALFFLAAAIDSGYDQTLVSIVVFAACSAGCVIAWLIGSVRFQLLLGSIFATFAWLALLDKVLSDGLASDLSTIRALLLVFAGGLVAASFAVRRFAKFEPEAAAGELLTGAGLSALIAFALGPVEALNAFQTAITATAFGVDPSEVGVSDPGQDMIWDVLTLITGAALILLGIGRGVRGSVYVGGAMLLLFVASAGLDLDDATPEGKIVGWPLLLCVLGAGAFVLSLLPGVRLPPALGLGGWFQGGREPTEGDPAAHAAPAPVGPAPAPVTPPAPPPAAEAPTTTSPAIEEPPTTPQPQEPPSPPPPAVEGDPPPR